MEVVLPGTITQFQDLSRGDLFVFDLAGTPQISVKARQNVEDVCVILSPSNNDYGGLPSVIVADLAHNRAVLKLRDAQLVASSDISAMALDLGSIPKPGTLILQGDKAFLYVLSGQQSLTLDLASGELVSPMTPGYIAKIRSWSIQQKQNDEYIELVSFPPRTEES